MVLKNVILSLIARTVILHLLARCAKSAPRKSDQTLFQSYSFTINYPYNRLCAVFLRWVVGEFFSHGVECYGGACAYRRATQLGINYKVGNR